jgi:hypothetical protein
MLRLLSILALAIIAATTLTGCCVCTATSVRNETGKDIQLTVIQGSQPVETVMVRASTTGICRGSFPLWPGNRSDSWIIVVGKSCYTFTNVSLIATLPDRFVSHSRFTRDFPCSRVARHVSVASDMTIHATRVIGYTESQPPLFPLQGTEQKAK